jgi:RNA polymerase sigma factor (sigma-70 family)
MTSPTTKSQQHPLLWNLPAGESERIEPANAASPGSLDDRLRRTLDPALRSLQPRLSRFIAARSKGRSDVVLDSKDVLQETFCRMLTNLAKGAYDFRRPLWPYLTGVATNVMAESRRAYQRKCWIQQLLRETHQPEGGSWECQINPENISIATSAMNNVEVWLATQSIIVREVWERHFLAGETEKRAAATLGISRRRMRKIVTKLQGELATAQGAPDP